jgi:hypothetical protein
VTGLSYPTILGRLRAQYHPDPVAISGRLTGPDISRCPQSPTCPEHVRRLCPPPVQPSKQQGLSRSPGFPFPLRPFSFWKNSWFGIEPRVYTWTHPVVATQVTVSATCSFRARGASSVGCGSGMGVGSARYFKALARPIGCGRCRSMLAGLTAARTHCVSDRCSLQELRCHFRALLPTTQDTSVQQQSDTDEIFAPSVESLMMSDA